MPALFLALLTAFLAMLGGRSALLTARLAGALGGSAALLAACWLTAIASSALAAWAGLLIAPLMAPAGKTMFVAAALALAALELLLFKSAAAPAEPTRSHGAIVLVLLARQVTDSARFLVLVLAVATAEPFLAAAGGALGSGAVLSAAWALGGEWERRLPLRAIRLGAAGVFVLAAIVTALTARGVFG
jgi:putative Ca2+/H+ antiporter (TMEM165/GDT1 family)